MITEEALIPFKSYLPHFLGEPCYLSKEDYERIYMGLGIEVEPTGSCVQSCLDEPIILKEDACGNA